MKVEGSYTFNAPVERVWDTLMDPAVLASCIPGCEKLEPVGADEYEAVLKVGIAAIKGTYKGKVRLTDKQPPTRYTMAVEGSGGPGFVKGTGAVELVPEGETTRVNVQGDAQVGGPVAGVGQRLIGGAARMLLGQFFDCLKRRVET